MAVPVIHLMANPLAETCQLLYAQGLVHATAGNVSVAVEDGFLITPSGYCLQEVTPESVVLVDGAGNATPPPGLKPSSEWKIHRRIYAARPQIGAVVHAHPAKATAMCLAGLSLEQPLVAEALLMLGKVPLLPYILPGSDALADAIYETLKTHHAVMLANHGVFTTGKDLREAYYRMELLESMAEMVILANSLGPINKLTEPQVQELYAATGHVPLG